MTTMPPVPVDQADVVAEIRARGLLLAGCSAGKLVVEFNYKDGCWNLGNVGLVFPRGRHLADPVRRRPA
jgi:hypothetical protein